MVLEFLEQQRRAFSPSTLMSNGILDFDFLKYCSIIEFDEKGIRNRPFRRVVIVNAVRPLLNTVYLRTKSVDARIGGGGVAVGLGCEFTEDQGIRHHVVDIMTVIIISTTNGH